jgi:hypothetical protein
MLQNLICIGLALSYFVAAGEVIPDDVNQKIQVTNTQRQDIAPGEVLHLKNSIGNLTVEGWTRDYVEITTIKSTKAAYASAQRQDGAKMLDTVRIGVARQGGEVQITTEFPQPASHARFFHGVPQFNLEYQIKVPRDARLVVDHGAGEVNVQNLANDIQVTVLHQGQVTLYLSPESKYAIEASAKYGGISSNLPGHVKRSRSRLGQYFKYQTSPASHKMSLKVGSGDILILTTPGLQADSTDSAGPHTQSRRSGPAAS